MVVLSSFFLVACGTEPPTIRFDEVTIAEEKANHIADLYFRYIDYENELSSINIRQKKGTYNNFIILLISNSYKDGRNGLPVDEPIIIDGVFFDYYFESSYYYAYNETTDEFGTVNWAYKEKYISKENIEEYKINNNVKDSESEGPSLKQFFILLNNSILIR